MKQQLKKFVLPILLLIPLSASAVTTTVTAHIGQMKKNDIWVITAESDTAAITEGDTIAGKSDSHKATLIVPHDVTKISYCAGTKKKCSGFDVGSTCLLTDNTTVKDGNSKIEIYLYPDHDYCNAVKYSA